MALGIEQNNVAPQLIQNSGAALVQGIRQIGQQISGHLTELQTKRDLGAMAQELQGLNVQSNEFPVQLTQMLSRHPLAARDERGQMALSILGKAHGQWQAGEAEARAFNRAMAMQTRRTQDARDQFDYETAAKRRTPQNIGGALVVPEDPVTGQPNVLLPAPARGGTTTPFRSTPQGIMDARTGEITSPPAPKTMTEYQKAQLRRGELKDKASAINAEINQFDSDITSAERAYEAAFKREMDTEDETEKQKHISTKTELGKIADSLRAEKRKRLDLLAKIRQEDVAAPVEEVVVEPELGAAPPVGVLPAPGAVAPAASNTEFVLVLDPSGKPGKIRASQLESALANGYRRR
jgi:hypothetical protein